MGSISERTRQNGWGDDEVVGCANCRWSARLLWFADEISNVLLPRHIAGNEPALNFRPFFDPIVLNQYSTFDYLLVVVTFVMIVQPYTFVIF
jgi:hypothetical protein